MGIRPAETSGAFTWQAGTFTWEPLLGTPYLGTLWDTSPRRPLLYLGTFTCKPANLRKLAGTCAGTLPTFTLEPLLGKICPWLGTLTWKSCGNQDCVTWEPCRNLFWGEPLLGQFAGTCIQGNLKNLERQTLSETVPCNVGRLGNLTGTFLWKPLLGDLYLGTLTCPHRNLHSTWIPLFGNLYLATFAQTLSETVPGNFGNIDLGTFIWKPLLGDPAPQQGPLYAHLSVSSLVTIEPLTPPRKAPAPLSQISQPSTSSLLPPTFP